MNEKAKKALIFVVIAAILFIVSGMDSIEIVGTYRLMGEGDYSTLEENVEEYGHKDAVKHLYTFGMDGKVTLELKYSNDAKRQIVEDYEELYGERKTFAEIKRSEMESVAEYGVRWKLNGTSFVIIQDGDYDNYRYSLQGKKLGIFEDDDFDDMLRFEKTFMSGLVCPSGLLRIAAIILLLIAAKKYFGGKKEETIYTVATGVNCANCGSAVAEGSKFCDNCGTPVAVPETPATEGKVCPNCNTPVAAGSKFCGNCGAVIAE